MQKLKMNKEEEYADTLPKESQEMTPLAKPFTFWVFFPNKTVTKHNYTNENKMLATITSVEEFCTVYQHMVRPDKMPEGSKFLLFQGGIRPEWEDTNNQGSGAFWLKVKKDYANKFWEELLMSFIGEQCDYNDDICG